MKNIELTYTNSAPLDAHPAAGLIKVACEFSSDISVCVNSRISNAKSILGLLSLGIKQGDHITISASGDDELEAAEAIAKFIESGIAE